MFYIFLLSLLSSKTFKHLENHENLFWWSFQEAILVYCCTFWSEKDEFSDKTIFESQALFCAARDKFILCIRNGCICGVRIPIFVLVQFAFYDEFDCGLIQLSLSLHVLQELKNIWLLWLHVFKLKPKIAVIFQTHSANIFVYSVWVHVYMCVFVFVLGAAINSAWKVAWKKLTGKSKIVYDKIKNLFLHGFYFFQYWGLKKFCITIWDPQRPTTLTRTIIIPIFVVVFTLFLSL